MYPCSVQLLVGTLSSNKSSGNLEMSDSTASIRLVPCVPYEPGKHTSRCQLINLRPGRTVALTSFTVFAEKTVETHQNSSVSLYLSYQDVSVLWGAQPQKGREKASRDSPSVVSAGESGATCDVLSEKQLCLLITNKNALKQKGTVSHFTAQACAYDTIEMLLKKPTPVTTANGAESGNGHPVSVAIDFDSAYWYPYLHNGFTYHLSCATTKGRALPSLKYLRKEPSITVSDDVSLWMICPALKSGVSYLHPRLGVGDIVSKLYLPKLKTAFTQPSEPSRLAQSVLLTTV